MMRRCVSIPFGRAAHTHVLYTKGARMTQSRRMLVLRAVVEDYIRSVHVLMLKLSNTRDMAKYLDSSICRGCALSPQDLIFTKTGPFSSLPLDQMDAFQTYHPLPPIVHLAKLLQPI